MSKTIKKKFTQQKRNAIKRLLASNKGNLLLNDILFVSYMKKKKPHKCIKVDSRQFCLCGIS